MILVRSLWNLVWFFALAQVPAYAGEAPHRPPRAAIVSAHPLATAAGMEILAAGGNAFDAAVAVSAALAVVEPRGSGLGGGGFYLLHRAKDDLQIFVDAREVAPAAATRDMFLGPNGEVVEGKSLKTALAAAIPGEPAGWAHLAEHYGTLPLGRSLEPAIQLARDGFPVYAQLVKDIERRKEDLLRTPDGQRIFFAHGKPRAVGTLIRQRDLAKSLEVLATQGAAGFYRGAFADKLVAGVRKLGGIWSKEDLQNYRPIERQPLRGRYRGANLITAPPPSAGGVILLQSLNVLSAYELGALDGATRKHLIVESLRRANRDRAQYMGDPGFVSLPVDELLSPHYAAGLRAALRLDRATASDLLPDAVGDAGAWRGSHTTHFSILDQDGNRVAATITLNALMGSGLLIPGTGILLNNEMDDFVSKPGVPNLYGLVGAQANAIEPGKRPLSSMTPTFVESERGLMILGTPGGSYIPTMVLLGVLNWLDGADAAAVVRAPRIHHQYRPDAVFAEPEALTAQERAALEVRGHHFRPWPEAVGNMQVITWDYASGAIVAAADPRGVGKGVVR